HRPHGRIGNRVTKAHGEQSVGIALDGVKVVVDLPHLVGQRVEPADDGLLFGKRRQGNLQGEKELLLVAIARCRCAACAVLLYATPYGGQSKPTAQERSRGAVWIRCKNREFVGYETTIQIVTDDTECTA